MMAALRLGVVDKSLMELRGLCEILGPGGVEGGGQGREVRVLQVAGLGPSSEAARSVYLMSCV